MILQGNHGCSYDICGSPVVFVLQSSESQMSPIVGPGSSSKTQMTRVTWRTTANTSGKIWQDYIWLVVWNYKFGTNHPNWLIFRGVGQPPTRYNGERSPPKWPEKTSFQLETLLFVPCLAAPWIFGCGSGFNWALEQWIPSGYVKIAIENGHL